MRWLILQEEIPPEVKESMLSVALKGSDLYNIRALSRENLSSGFSTR